MIFTHFIALVRKNCVKNRIPHTCQIAVGYNQCRNAIITVSSSSLALAIRLRGRSRRGESISSEGIATGSGPRSLLQILPGHPLEIVLLINPGRSQTVRAPRRFSAPRPSAKKGIGSFLSEQIPVATNKVSSIEICKFEMRKRTTKNDDKQYVK